MLQRGTDIADRLIGFFELSNTIPEHKRRLFIGLQLLCILVIAFDLALAPLLAIDRFNLIAGVLMILFLTATTWLLWRRRDRQELILLAVVFGSALFLLAVMSYNLSRVASTRLNEGLLPVVGPWYIWFIVLYMACFLTFRAGTALRVASLISALVILILLVYLVRAGTPHLGAIHDFILLCAANGVVILMAYPLAKAQEQTSETDFLTGLVNRTRGYNLLVAEIERAQRYQTNFSVILFDIDHFKKINDTYGHPTGDAVLREVADFVKQRTRRTDVLCRWGGEEFLLLMTHTDLASARLKADHLRTQLKSRAFYETIQLTSSFGVTTYYPHDSTNTLLERADNALYRAKRSGRNCVEVE